MSRHEHFTVQPKVLTIINEINKTIIGKNEVIEKVLMAILAKGHILLEDTPGVGKTTLALAFSKTMGLDYKRIQFTPEIMRFLELKNCLKLKETSSIQMKFKVHTPIFQ